MKLIKIIFTIICFLTFQNLFSQWQTFNTQINTAYNEVCVVNQNVIWAVGYYRIIVRTTNGGATWQNVNFGLPATFNMNHITAIDANTAWVSGSSSWTMERVFKTTNGGMMWYEQYIPDPYYINKIHFFNTNTGILLKDHLNPPGLDTAGYYVTRNGGINWYRPAHQPLIVAFHDNCLNFLDTNFIYFIEGGKLRVMRNGLDNMFQQRSTIGSYSLAFTDTLNGVAAGTTDSVYRTTNGGYYWSKVSAVPMGYAVTSVVSVPGTFWYLISGLHVMKLSYNFGTAFQCQVVFSSPDTTTLGFSHAADTNSFWVPANGGKLFKYNFAYIGVQQISNEVPSEFMLYQNFPNPFNPDTKIQFEIPKASDIELVIYDVSGKEVYRLAEQNRQPGKYEINFNASTYASGVYFYKLVAGDFTKTMKMVLLK